MSIFKKENKSPKGVKSLALDMLNSSPDSFYLEIVTGIVVASSAREGQWKAQYWMKAEKANLGSPLLL